MRGYILILLLMALMSVASAINVNTCSGLQTAIKSDFEINLTSNIDCSATDFSNWYYHNSGGPHFPNGYKYTQNFYGNNFTISNMLINGSGLRRTALIPITNGSNQVIRDLIINNSHTTNFLTQASILVANGQGSELFIQNVQVNNGTISDNGGQTAGGLIAYTNNVTIVYSSFQGLLNSSLVEGTGGGFMGGLLGFSDMQTFNITRSSADVVIWGKDFFGGLVGFVERTMYNASITDSYVHADLIATADSSTNPGGAARMGGVIGYMTNATIFVDKIYSAVNVEANIGSGTFIGTCQFSNFTFISSSYTLRNNTQAFPTSFDCPSTGLTRKDDAELKLRSTYIGWDFDNTWGIISGESYPKFQSQFGDSDGDGILDHLDNVFGNESDISFTGIDGVVVKIDQSSQVNQTYNDVKPVIINSTSGKLLEFNYNFTKKAINFSRLRIEKQSNGILIDGLEISEGQTKTIYANVTSLGICVKDSPESTFNTSELCNGENEVSFAYDECLSTSIKSVGDHSVTCEIDNGIFKVSGLENSQIVGQNAVLNYTHDGNEPIALGDTINFYANYTNLSSGQNVLDANCTIQFNDDTPINMTFNGEVYQYTTAFLEGGIKDVNVTCSKTGFDTLSITEQLIVTAGVIPEFSDYALIMVLLGSCFISYYIRRQNNVY